MKSLHCHGTNCVRIRQSEGLQAHLPCCMGLSEAKPEGGKKQTIQPLETHILPHIVRETRRTRGKKQLTDTNLLSQPLSTQQCVCCLSAALGVQWRQRELLLLFKPHSKSV
ncbi:hypothetical protein SRHO_G00043320 [Serrasalmus rhombeus]